MQEIHSEPKSDFSLWWASYFWIMVFSPIMSRMKSNAAGSHFCWIQQCIYAIKSINRSTFNYTRGSQTSSPTKINATTFGHYNPAALFEKPRHQNWKCCWTQASKTEGKEELHCPLFLLGIIMYFTSVANYGKYYFFF